MIFRNILVIAPHPDDESLGCGGSLLRFRDEYPETRIHWVIVTGMRSCWGFSDDRIAERDLEIVAAGKRLRTEKIYQLGFQPAYLDAVPLADLVSTLGDTITDVRPDTIFVPWRYDVHTDHRVVFDAAAACVKTFRQPSVRSVLAYETLSETEFALDPAVSGFRPNVWIDISTQLDAKLDLVSCYRSEMRAFPFPRSVEAVMALARLRGSNAGVHAAEAFMLLKGIL